MRNRNTRIVSALLSLAIMLAQAAPAFAYAAPAAVSFSTAVPVTAQSLIQLQGSDADGTSLTYATTTSPSHGALSQLNTSTGAVVYTPAAGYTGADSFNYTVTSGGDTTAAATVSITVTAAQTRVVETFNNPDGTPRRGKVSFFLTQVASSPSGIIPAKASVSCALTSSGVCTVSLYPSRAVSPVQYYQAWFDDSTTGNSQLIGLYDIPASTATISLAGHRITDANLSAQFVFASRAEVDALTRAVAAATISQMFPSLTSGKHFLWNGTSFVASVVSESGTSVSVAGSVTATSFSGPLIGNVTGNLTGNVTGNLTGNVVGNITGTTGSFSGTVTAGNLVGNCSACTGIAVGTSTGHSAAASVSIIADSDNSGGGSNDAGGIIDFMTGSTTRARVHNSGQFEFMAGTKVSGGTQTFTGTYTDWRSTTPQVVARADLLVDLGGDTYVNHYFKNSRSSAGGGQFGVLSEIILNTANGGGASYWNGAVAISGWAATLDGNTGTGQLQGGNFGVSVGTGATLPSLIRGIEIDINNNVADAATPNPNGQLTAGETFVGLQVISGGVYKPEYGVMIGSSNASNKWQVALSIPVEGFNWRALALGNPSVSQGAGLLVGHAYSTIETLNFARADTAASSSSSDFMRLRNATLTTNLFRIDLDGSVYTNGILFLGQDTSATFFWKYPGSPNGAVSAAVGSVILDTTGAGVWYKATGAGTNTGWVLKAW